MSEVRRVKIELDESLYNRVLELWPWGVRGKILAKMTELAVEVTEKYGQGVLGLLLAGELELRPRAKYIRNSNEGEKDGKLQTDSTS